MASGGWVACCVCYREDGPDDDADADDDVNSDGNDNDDIRQSQRIHV